jgi:carbonic anhydrase/acetyltransferase-like protein (isoleucine patch superfamily)
MSAVRRARAARDRARFASWAAVLRLRLRRQGVRLVVDAPHGARFRTPPTVELWPTGPGTTVLRVADDVDLGRHLTLELWTGGKNELTLGAGVVLGSHVRLGLRDGMIRLGHHTRVRDGVVLKSDGLLDAREHGLISFGSVFHCHERIEFGPYATCSEHVTVVDSTHLADGTATHHMRQPIASEPVRVGRNTLVSAGARLLPGCRLGDDAMVGAGAVVRRGEYPDGWLVAGVPARAVRALGAVAAAP